MKHLKTNNKWARQRGTTLIELSVVIAVLLLLAGVLFIGITGWKNSANTAACVLNLATAQKAMRSYENTMQLNSGDGCTMANLIGAGYFVASPTCPSAGTYTIGATVTAPGVAYITCSLAGHAPKSVANW
jgi:prepilin-type N-terminal cleavage/methylation domain-containing protein